MKSLLAQKRLMLLFLILTAFLGFYLLNASGRMKRELTVTQNVLQHDGTPSFPSTKDDRNNSSKHQPNTDPGSNRASQEEQMKEEKSNSEQTKPKQNTDSLKSETQVKSNLNKAPEKTVKEAKPTEPDFFGDTYATDDPPLQTSCPSSIRRKILQTPFAKIFLGNVPVLQWAKHFSEKEYQRLSRYPGAHGWGSVDIDVLKNSLVLLNTTANKLMCDDWEKRPNRSQCIRCAVIGNGGILKGSNKGKEIDQHDYVFRTNGAVTKGFEEDVGTRTSFYTFSTNTLRNSMRNYAGAGYLGPPLGKETKYVFLPDHDRDYILMKAAATHTPIVEGPEKSLKPPHYFGDDVTVDKFKIYHPDFIRYLRNRFLRSHTLNTRYKDIYRPSTGAVMLLAAFHTCDEVNAYGFMTPDFHKYSDHYYDRAYSPVRFYANHDFRLELKLWQQLHQAGLMKLYMRS